MLYLLNNCGIHFRFDNFYPTALPNYFLKIVDLDFNTHIRSKERSYYKGLGKTPKKPVIDHFRYKLKKRNNKVKTTFP